MGAHPNLLDGRASPGPGVKKSKSEADSARGVVGGGGVARSKTAPGPLRQGSGHSKGGGKKAKGGAKGGQGDLTRGPSKRALSLPRPMSATEYMDFKFPKPASPSTLRVKQLSEVSAPCRRMPWPTLM